MEYDFCKHLITYFHKVLYFFTGRKLSDEAAEAETIEEIWQLFITDKILDLIVKQTNVKIAEDLDKGKFSNERLAKSPYLRPTDTA